jgi:O-antigen/teichoic acid export membrane protein
MNWGQIRARILMVGGSQLLQKLVGFLIIAVMTRHLARERMGEFFLAAAIGTVAAQATELGTGRHLIRSVAKDHAGALGQLSRVLALRLPVMLLVFLVVNVACLIVKPSLSPTLRLVSLYLLLQDLTFTFSAFFVGLERYGYRVAVELLGQVLLAGCTLLLVYLGGGLTAILWAYIGAHVTVLAVMYAIVRSGWCGTSRRRGAWPGSRCRSSRSPCSTPCTSRPTPCCSDSCGRSPPWPRMKRRTSCSRSHGSRSGRSRSSSSRSAWRSPRATSGRNCAGCSGS